MKRIVPVVIAVLHDPVSFKLLLTQRNETDREDKQYTNPWNFPGGDIRFGEKNEDALKREIREELGVEIIIEQMFPKVYSQVRGKWHGILLCYLCRMKKRNSKIILNNESIQYKWLNLPEIKKINTLPHSYDIAECVYSILS